VLKVIEECAMCVEAEENNDSSPYTSAYNRLQIKCNQCKRYKSLRNRWFGMKSRCYNKYHKGYKDYGGRGITVCDEWLYSFETFSNWAYETGYKEELTLDRKNNDDNYTPDNCRWITMLEQNNNRRKQNKEVY